MAKDGLTPISNPYVGPRTFSEKDGPLFFGRERESRELLSLVISEPLTLFYARSGAGKSSLINTRLIPGLRDEEFVVLPVVRVSGALPAGVTQVNNIFVFNLLLNLDQNQHDPRTLAQETLADHLKNSQSLLTDPSIARVLIIDQFEEIFTAHLDRWQERKGFFEQLAQAMKRDPLLWVVLSMREDYVASLDPFVRMLPGRLRPRLFMQRMDAETALAAIEEPAEEAGRPFAPNVAQALVDNLRQIRGQTASEVVLGEFVEPVQLQVVCYQLWENLRSRPPGPITQEDVDELGNVDLALGQFYEQAIAKVAQETGLTELTLRNWFEQELITESHTRGTVHQGKDSTAGLPNTALALLINQFLLRSEFRAGGTWYELVHDRFVEPILQANIAWRLRQSPLVQTAEAWERASRPPEMLYRGGQLREALAKNNIETVEEPVKSFLQASQSAQNERDLERAQELATEERRKADEADLRAKEESIRAERERKTANRLRILATALIVAFFLVAAALLVAYWQNQEAVAQANANATLAEVNAIAVETSDYYAVEANYLVQTANAAYATSDTAIVTSEAYAEELVGVAATSDANAGLAATRAQEAEDANLVAEAALAETELQACVNSAQALSAQAILTLNQPENNTELATLLAVQASTLPCVEEDTWPTVMNLTETVLQDVLTRPYFNTILQAEGSTVRAVAFSSDGRWLAAANDDGSVLVYDLSSRGSSPLRLLAHTGIVRAVAFNSQTGQLATAGDDSLIHLWDVANPSAPIATLTGHTGIVRTVAFHPAGTLLASGGDDKVLRIWDLANDNLGKNVINREAHANAIFSLTFAQSSSQLYIISGSSDSVNMWDTARLALVGPLRISSSQRFLNSLAISRTGRLLATVGSDASVRLWDITNVGNVPAPSPITLNVAQIGAVTFNPTNNTLFVGDSSGVIRLWDLPRFTSNPGLADETLTGPQSAIFALAVSSDGSLLASATATGEIRLWQLTSPTSGEDVGDDPDLTFDDLLVRACEVVRRNLTAEEWTVYVASDDYLVTCANLPANSQ